MTGKVKLCISLLAAAIFSMTGGNAKEPKGLSLSEAREAHTRVLAEWRKEKAAALKSNDDSKVITIGENHLKFWYTEYGQEPEGGHSLWISLHGGGGTAEEVNNGQWENQKYLYKPAEGIYLCPRAPWNAWNMWFQEPIDAMYEELITTMVTVKGVNPDKVYLMGYSAGGDGVWRLAPRLADHWAAASMMAGHPGDVSLLNVRNLPFSIWVGSEDSAYNRNREVAGRGRELEALRAEDPEGYVHQTHVMEGYGHWMERRDTTAVPWMANFIRNPYPRHLIWQQEEVLRPSFYWVSVPKDELERGKQVIADISGNTINISRCDYTGMTIYLNDQLVNLDKKVTVLYKGKVVSRGKVARSEKTMRQTLYDRNDPSYMFDAAIELEII